MDEIIVADKHLHQEAIRSLSQDYLCWVVPLINTLYHTRFSAEDILEQDMQTLDKFSPPRGRMILAISDDFPVGIVGLKELQGQTGEVKRMFVHPEHRKKGLGRAMLEKLLAEARLIGYQYILLDSARFMEDAHRLYRHYDFVDIPPYQGSEIPKEFQAHWVFMEKDLTR